MGVNVIERHILLANVQNQIDRLDELMDQLEEVIAPSAFSEIQKAWGTLLTVKQYLEQND